MGSDDGNGGSLETVREKKDEKVSGMKRIETKDWDFFESIKVKQGNQEPNKPVFFKNDEKMVKQIQPIANHFDRYQVFTELFNS